VPSEEKVVDKNTIDKLIEENKFLKKELSKNKDELSLLKTCNTHDAALSVKEIKILDKEMELLRQMYFIDLENFGETSGEDIILVPSFFEGVASNVKEKCPLLTSIVKTLAVGTSTERNSGKKDSKYKFKARFTSYSGYGRCEERKNKKLILCYFWSVVVCSQCGKDYADHVRARFGLCKSYEF
jgi:hypothetical protein